MTRRTYYCFMLAFILLGKLQVQAQPVGQLKEVLSATTDHFANHLEFSKNGGYLVVVVGFNADVYKKKENAFQFLQKLKGGKYQSFYPGISEDGRFIAFSNDDDTYIYKNNQDKFELFQTINHNAAASSHDIVMRFTGNEKLLVVGAEGNIRFYDLKEDKFVESARVIHPAGLTFEEASLSPNGSSLATLDEKGVVQCWQITGHSALPGNRLLTTNRYQGIIDITDDFLLAAGAKDSLNIYELASDFSSVTPVHSFSNNKYSQVRFNPDGNRVMISDDTGGLQVHKIAGKQVILESVNKLSAKTFTEFKLSQDGKWIAATSSGAETLKIFEAPERLVIAKRSPAKGKTEGKPKPWIAEPVYLNAFMFTDGMAPVLGDNYNWGYINMTGKQVIKFDYKYAMPFSEGVAAVSKTEKDWQLINKQGVPITKTIFDNTPSLCKNGLIAVSIAGKWGFINKTGKIVIPATYYAAREFSEGLAVVWLNDSTSIVIDASGKTIIPVFKNASYNRDAVFHYGFARITFAGRDHFISKTGSKITEPADKSWQFTYGNAAFVEGMLIVEDRKTKLRGAIDTAGNLIIPIKFNDLHNFSDGFAIFNNNKKWNYIDKKGNIVLNTDFPIAEGFQDGFAANAENAKGSWKWYFINKYGLVVPGVVFDEIIDWDNDVALIKLGGRKGFANMKLLAGDKNRKPVINEMAKESPKEPLLKMFRDKNGLYGFQDINNGFNIAIPAEYRFVGKFSEGLVAVTKDGDKWGYVDPSGKLVIPYRFVSAEEFMNGKALVEEGDMFQSRKFYIDKSGKKL